jgi:hypothetical protein
MIPVAGGATMSLRHTTIRKNGKTRTYWRLVRSVRTGRVVKQVAVCQLGELDEQGRLAARQLADTLVGIERQPGLFDAPVPAAPIALQLAQLQLERGRRFGDVWLALKVWQALRLDELFEQLIPEGREEAPWSVTAAILVVARLCEPSSKLSIAANWFRKTALGDLRGVTEEQINDDRLYRAMDELLPHKDALERPLKERFGALFGLEYDLLLYDVTSTYFEGLTADQNLAQRGDSRDHRSDCLQVCIGLVVTRDGFPLGYEVFAGNRNDSTTLREGLEVQQVRADENTEEEAQPETFILCRSADRAAKERAMRERFAQRIQTGLEQLQEGCRHSKPGKLETGAVERLVGRLMGKNTRAASFFEVRVATAPSGRPELTWKRCAVPLALAELRDGCYLLRTHVTDWTPEDLWPAYIHPTDVEAAFREQNDQQGLRPIWHRWGHRIQAHILVCFLGYALQKTLEGWRHKAGLGRSPRKVLDELAHIHSTDVAFPTPDGRTVRLRCIVRPERAQTALLDRLGLE